MPCSHTYLRDERVFDREGVRAQLQRISIMSREHEVWEKDECLHS